MGFERDLQSDVLRVNKDTGENLVFFTLCTWNSRENSDICQSK